MPRDLEREKRFGTWLTKLGVSLRQEVDEATLEVYTGALCYQVEPEEWRLFVRQAIETGRFGTWFPKVPELLDALREFRGAPKLDTEATAAYERVLAASIYTPGAGATWTYRGVLQRCGRAAADAFQAAGGQHAFATTWNEAKRRERFVEAYVEEARAEPETRLLPAPDVLSPKLLTGTVESVTAVEAAEAVRQVAQRAEESGLLKPRVKAQPVMTDAEWRERRDDMLRRLRESEAAVEPAETT